VPQNRIKELQFPTLSKITGNNKGNQFCRIKPDILKEGLFSKSRRQPLLNTYGRFSLTLSWQSFKIQGAYNETPWFCRYFQRSQMIFSGDRGTLRTIEVQIPACIFTFAHRHLSLVVNALGYKPESRGFENRWGEILNLPSPSGHTRPWGLIMRKMTISSCIASLVRMLQKKISAPTWNRTRIPWTSTHLYTLLYWWVILGPTCLSVHKFLVKICLYGIIIEGLGISTKNSSNF
jgi:hypothetical protein